MAEQVFKGETGAERRRFPRKPLRLRVQFRCLDVDEVSPVEHNLANDLGAGGLAMRTERPLPEDQLLMLSLFLPVPEQSPADREQMDLTRAESLSVDILSRVAWCASSKEGEFVAGVQFLDLDRDGRKLLKRFLAEYRLYQPESTIHF